MHILKRKDYCFPRSKQMKQPVCGPWLVGLAYVFIKYAKMVHCIEMVLIYLVHVD